MPLRLNVDQVSGLGGGRSGVSPTAAKPLSPTCAHILAPQDALLFLRDYFSSLAAGINPMVPAEASAEGEKLDLVGEGHGFLLPSHPWAHPYSV